MVKDGKTHNLKRLMAAREDIRSMALTGGGGLRACEERCNTVVSGSDTKRVLSGDTKREDDFLLDLFLQQAMEQKR